MAKTYNRKSEEEKEREVNELLEKANKSIEECFTSEEQIKELADYMRKFYKYSVRNTMLIQSQFEGAMAVGSYAFWKEKGFSVNKGEKGIKILVPNKLSDYFINSNGKEIPIKKANEEEKRKIEKGEIEVFEGKLIFNQGYVFDISQTNAKAEDLPKIFPNRWLEGEVKDYDLMYKAMENIAKKIGVTIIEPREELGSAKGVSYPLTKEVALNPRNTQLQNVKTLVHELAHAKLHTVETRSNYTRNEREFQAELTAYTVCKYFGLDTSEYSFRYISDWTKDTELEHKENLLKEVKETVKEYIEVIDDTLTNEIELQIENELVIEEKDISLYEVKEMEQDKVETDNYLHLAKKEFAEVEFREMKENIEELMFDNYENFIKAIISIEKGVEDLDVLNNVYSHYMDNEYNLLNDSFESAINELDSSEHEINSLNKTVEVGYSELDSFREGEKLTLEETLERFKIEVENGAIDKAIEFTFSLNENIKYNEEFIIDNGSNLDLKYFIDEKLEGNNRFKELVEEYMENNGYNAEKYKSEKSIDKNKEKQYELEM